MWQQLTLAAARSRDAHHLLQLLLFVELLLLLRLKSDDWRWCRSEDCWGGTSAHFIRERDERRRLRVVVVVDELRVRLAAHLMCARRAMRVRVALIVGGRKANTLVRPDGRVSLSTRWQLRVEKTGDSTERGHSLRIGHCVRGTETRIQKELLLLLCETRLLKQVLGGMARAGGGGGGGGPLADGTGFVAN